MTAPKPEAPTLDELIAIIKGREYHSGSEWSIANAILASLERLRAIENARPENPCNCVPDGDDGTIAHLCHWHKQMLGKAYRMQNVANTLTVERIAKLPQDKLRLWIAHGIQESTARKRAEEQLAELRRQHDGLVRAAEKISRRKRYSNNFKMIISSAAQDEHWLALDAALAKLNGADK